MALIAPNWMKGQRCMISSMDQLPDGCTPNTTYLCFRFNQRKDGSKERRCFVALDAWGPNGWQSPSLGDGSYIGLSKIPVDDSWRLSSDSLPAPEEMVLIYVPDCRHSWMHTVPPGFYLGRCDRDDMGNPDWRIKLPWMQRQVNFPAVRRYVRIMSTDRLKWLPLPVNNKEKSDV